MNLVELLFALKAFLDALNAVFADAGSSVGKVQAAAGSWAGIILAAAVLLVVIGATMELRQKEV